MYWVAIQNPTFSPYESLRSYNRRVTFFKVSVFVGRIWSNHNSIIMQCTYRFCKTILSTHGMRKQGLNRLCNKSYNACQSIGQDTQLKSGLHSMGRMNYYWLKGLKVMLTLVGLVSNASYPINTSYFLVASTMKMLTVVLQYLCTKTMMTVLHVNCIYIMSAV